MFGILLSYLLFKHLDISVGMMLEDEASGKLEQVAKLLNVTPGTLSKEVKETVVESCKETEAPPGVLNPDVLSPSKASRLHNHLTETEDEANDLPQLKPQTENRSSSLSEISIGPDIDASLMPQVVLKPAAKEMDSKGDTSMDDTVRIVPARDGLLLSSADTLGTSAEDTSVKTGSGSAGKLKPVPISAVTTKLATNEYTHSMPERVTTTSPKIVSVASPLLKIVNKDGKVGSLPINSVDVAGKAMPFEGRSTLAVAPSLSATTKVSEKPGPPKGTAEHRPYGGTVKRRKLNLPSPAAPLKLAATDPVDTFLPKSHLKTIEMRDPVTGRVMITFQTALDAAKATDIKAHKIVQACKDGGGLVGGHFFRYLDPMADVEDEDGVDDIVVTGVSPVPGNITNPYPDNPISKNPKTQAPSTIKAPPEGLNQDEIAHEPDDEKAQSTSKLNVVQPQLTETKRKGRILPLAASRPSSTVQDAQLPIHDVKSRPDFFDFTTLKPIRKKKKPLMHDRKMVELMELRTLKVLVCFRSAADTSRALGIDRREVIDACEKYSKVKPVTFKTFTLRYAQKGHYAAYIYGDHAEDYKSRRKETSAETAARFLRVFKEKGKDGSLGQPPEMTLLNSLQKPPPSDEVVSELPAAVGKKALVADAHIDQKKVDLSNLKTGLDGNTMCLVCQSVPPHVVFEPCYHAVLCSSCAENTCKFFCPTCHTPITRRVEPKFAILVRPRIYSAYSFM